MTESMVAELEYLPELPPTHDQLPCSDGVPMETERHQFQLELLTQTLRLHWTDQTEGYVGGNMFIYFSTEYIRSKDFRGPDVFVVCGVPKKERKCWVVWEEGKGPDVVIELLSGSTAEQDKTTKKRIYQNQLRVPEYFWYDPFHAEDFAGFALQDGSYEPIEGKDRLISKQLQLALVKWQGIFQETEAVWLRWATLDGQLLPTAEEVAEQEHQRAERERQRAERERQRAERLAARLREMGVDPDQIEVSEPVPKNL